ncbi:MAG: hypothetical protein K6A37_10040 [Saccharofermentans sp.]|nr:hypothetical protein [Saccharofermentans sp.]
MGVEEFISSIEKITINSELSSKVEEEYHAELSEYVRKILSFDANGYFFGDNKRILSINEILTADDELHVNFKQLKLVPIFDTGDNDFIVYSYEDDIWKLFNIVDRIEFHQSPNLSELLLI